jgi:catechol 2,3-dioxygenase-like lactoylglutathione lyase family enzyme
MRFGHIEILAADPVRSRQFYQEILGFEVSLIYDRMVLRKVYSDKV